MDTQLTIFDILTEPVTDIEVNQLDFDSKIRMSVMAAIKNMGFIQYFDYESTEISIVSMSTADKNIYFPDGCAMMHIYVIGDKATTDLMIVNQFAIDNHLDWVEHRNYDHRYFTRYHVGMMLHEERLKPIRERYSYYTLEQYRSFHFAQKKENTWFQYSGKISDEIIEGFYKWGF